ncbi:MAG TPA: Bax inhibitor-1 family protein [Ktedonobacteraceae bacterium]|nr:Bax inhibitor-1 family protein [Ktedonobacteraceae bacterium]
MYNMPNNNPYGNPYGGRRGFAQYQTMPGYEASPVQAASLISKVMVLLSFSFLFAAIGTFIGMALGISFGTYIIIAIAGLVVLFILQFAIRVQGLNLFLLYLFTFLEGLSLAPIISVYLASGLGNILGEAFLITAITSLGLAAYAWTTKRDFSHLGRYLFFGLILLIVLGILGIFFGSFFGTGPIAVLIAILGVAIFSGYMLFYVQRAKYMPDTMPNAIMLTVSLFITVLNLFLYILELLSILQGGRSRR